MKIRIQPENGDTPTEVKDVLNEIRDKLSPDYDDCVSGYLIEGHYKRVGDLNGKKTK